jgi:hypothetical protein
MITPANPFAKDVRSKRDLVVQGLVLHQEVSIARAVFPAAIADRGPDDLVGRL